MQFIHADNEDKGIQEMADRIVQALSNGAKVLWLVCGGSNIPFSVEAMNIIRQSVGNSALANLTVGLTDERYGPVEHSDSNWKLLLENGFLLSGVSQMPMLSGKPLEETVCSYADRLKAVMSGITALNGLIVAQFGMGADGHIAGIFPHSVAVSDQRFVCGYKADTFTRMTLTPVALKEVMTAYAFVFGNTKRAALRRLHDEDLSVDEQPAQILKQIKEVSLYSDQI